VSGEFMSDVDKEYRQALEDRAYWTQIAEALNLRLYGWSGRNTASFTDKTGQHTIQIPNWLAEEILNTLLAHL
jgi:hypothetical protein